MVEPGAVSCPYCGSAVAEGSKFCPSCGAAQAPAAPTIRYCSNCGSQSSASSTFCPQCGTNLQTPWTSPYQPAPPDGSYGTYRKSNGRAVAVIIAVALVAMLIVAAILASGMLAPSSSGKVKDGNGTYTWTYSGRTYSLGVNISAEEYKLYHDDPTQRYAYTIEEAVSMCDIYVTPNDTVVRALANMLSNYSASFSDLKKANFVLSFVQNIEYVEDEISVSKDDYWRFPVETLYDKMGDCEDKAFLYASLMEAMGFDAVILLFDGHAAAGIAAAGAAGSYYEYQGHEYFYCETTAVGWEVGDIPEEYGSAYIAQVS